VPPQICHLGVALLVWAPFLIPQACAQAPESVSDSLQQQLAAAEHPFLRGRDLPLETLRAVYARGGQAPIWQRSGKPTAPAQALVRLLRDAEAYGLRPSDYDADLIEAQTQELLAARDTPAARRAELDLRLSAAALKFARHVHYGQIDPRECGFELYAPRSDLDEGAVIRKLASTSRPAAELAAIEPRFDHYRLLKAALAKYRRLAAEPGLTALPKFAGRSIKPGGRYSGAAELRRLLATLGDLGAEVVAPSDAETLDDALVTALRSFQARHGLPADGVLGKRTFAALTVPLARRVRQIELTLERWRWLRPFETPPIVVNLPAYRLYAFRTTDDRESDMLMMNVIVGQSYPETRTPVFLAEMKYVVFKPYWDVPDTIVQREMLPAIREDSGFLVKNHMELVRGSSDDSPVVPPSPESIEALASGALRLRQQPNGDNALGAIKFVLPNYHSVYLHSTPARRLFKETRRDFSHGCIRVNDPAALAAHVLRNAPGDWTEEKIEDAMKGAPNRRVNLSKPILVMIVYATAVATESGQVLFFEDIYGHDERLEQLLRGKSG
jgi:murein L,D-transpeptidase YcbB/YkuD